MTKIAKKEKNNWKDTIKISATKAYILLLLVSIIILCFGVFSKIEIETEGWCNSGNINLDIEAENFIQNTTCWDTHFNSSGIYKTPDKSRENITCFDQSFMLQHIKLKGLDGLNCQGSAKIKMPLIMSWFMGDRY